MTYYDKELVEKSIELGLLAVKLMNKVILLSAGMLVMMILMVVVGH